jgi:signal transduction histidine kinase/CheY-like chemotaxis protein
MTALEAWLRTVSAGGSSAPARYSLALATVVVAVAVHVWLTAGLGLPVDYLTFYAAAFFVAWFAGRVPALCAVALMSVCWFTVAPSSVLRGSAHVVQLAMLATGGMVIAEGVCQLRNAVRRTTVLQGHGRRLCEIASVLAAGTTVADMGQRVLAAASSAIGAMTGAVLRVDSATGDLICVCSAGRTPDADVRWRRIALGSTFATREAARTRRPVVIRNVREWIRLYPETAPHAGAAGLTCALVLPLVIERRLVGLVALSGSRVPVAGDEWAFIEAVQTECTLALARAELYEAAERSRAELFDAAERSRLAEAAGRSRAERLRVYLQHLQEVTAAFSRSGTVPEVAEAFVAAVEALFGGRAGALYRLVPGWGVLELVASPRYADTLARLNARMRLEAETPSAEAVRTRRPVVVKDLEQMKRRFPAMVAGLQEINATSCVALPLIFEDRVIGAVGFAAERRLEFDADDASFLGAIAGQCAIALSRAEADEQTSRAREMEAAHRLRMEKLLTHAERLQAATAAFSRSLTASDIADVVMTTGLRSLGAVTGGITRVGAADDLEVVASVSLNKDAERHPTRYRTGDHLLSTEAARRRMAMVIRNSGEWEQRFPASAADARIGGLTACVAVPLISETVLRGTMTFAWDNEFTPGDDEIRFIEALGTQYLAALDRAGAYEAERKARQVAEESGRVREEFLATVSHELRTPLNSILGWADILRRPVLDASRLRQGLNIIAASGRMQADLIDQLLQMSLMVAGKTQLRMAAATPAAIMESAVNVVRPAAEAKSIALEVRRESAGDAYWCDAQRLQQVLWNLLSNAVKFTPVGGRVSLTQRDTVGGIVFTVADTGIGIPKHFLPHVFERFKQADSSSTRAYGGLGLGLAITRHLVELHGGTIHAESDGPGQGARFILELPVRPVPPSHQPVSPWVSSPSFDSRPLPTLDGVRVLVVDDDPGAREITAAGLVGTGASVTTVESADEALAVLREAPFDVVVADIGMPGKDGYALIRELRSSDERAGSRIPAVAVTAYTSQKDRAAALEAGYQAHLPKPVDLAILAETLFRLARGSARAPGQQHQSM